MLTPEKYAALTNPAAKLNSPKRVSPTVLKNNCLPSFRLLLYLFIRLIISLSLQKYYAPKGKFPFALGFFLYLLPRFLFHYLYACATLTTIIL